MTLDGDNMHMFHRSLSRYIFHLMCFFQAGVACISRVRNRPVLPAAAYAITQVRCKSEISLCSITS